MRNFKLVVSLHALYHHQYAFLSLNKWLVCKGVIHEKRCSHLAGVTDVSTSAFNEMCKDFEALKCNENQNRKETKVLSWLNTS